MYASRSLFVSCAHPSFTSFHWLSSFGSGYISVLVLSALKELRIPLRNTTIPGLHFFIHDRLLHNRFILINPCVSVMRGVVDHEGFRLLLFFPGSGCQGSNTRSSHPAPVCRASLSNQHRYAGNIYIHQTFPMEMS
uniref:Uncharacterized protein n=1 Tax=Compsopogon caeruleus TaxID=31354 RepID=A0A7S1TDK7_9RHOD